MKPRFPSPARRLRALVGAVAMVAAIPLVLTGCSGSGSAASGGKTLTIEDYYAAHCRQSPTFAAHCRLSSVG